MARRSSDLTRKQGSPRVPRQEKQSRSGDRNQGQPCDPVITAKSAGRRQVWGQAKESWWHEMVRRSRGQGRHNTPTACWPQRCVLSWDRGKQDQSSGGSAIPSCCGQWSQVSAVPTLNAIMAQGEKELWKLAADMTHGKVNNLLQREAYCWCCNKEWYANFLLIIHTHAHTPHVNSGGGVSGPWAGRAMSWYLSHDRALPLPCAISAFICTKRRD